MVLLEYEVAWALPATEGEWREDQMQTWVRTWLKMMREQAKVVVGWQSMMRIYSRHR